jgi:ABC-type taurine transport system ATPase subunit
VVSSAPVVLLDEPTTSLDAEAARQVVGAIRSATRDRTVLLVTHDPVLAAIADRTVHVAPLWYSASPDAPSDVATSMVATQPAATPKVAPAGVILPDAAVAGVPVSDAEPNRSPVLLGQTEAGRR